MKFKLNKNEQGQIVSIGGKVHPRLEKVYDDIDYLFSKINWGASFMDAKAIQIMNNLKGEIEQAHDEAFSDGVSCNSSEPGN